MFDLSQMVPLPQRKLNQLQAAINALLDAQEEKGISGCILGQSHQTYKRFVSDLSGDGRKGASIPSN